MSSPTSPPEPPPPSAPSAEEDHAQAFDRAASKLETLLGALPAFRHLATLPAMPETLASIEQELGALTAALANPELGPVLQHLEDAENDLLDMDALFPDAAVHGLLGAGVPAESVVQYARLLAWHLSPERFERVVDTMMRLCLGKDGKVRPFEEVSDLLIALGVQSDVRLETLGAAGTFFESAISRLAAFDSLDTLFKSGFLMDVAGYRISLRSQLLEPEILYGSIRLEAALQARIAALASEARVSQVVLADRLAKARQEVDEVFKIARHEAAGTEKFVRRRVRVRVVVPEHTLVQSKFSLGGMRGLALAFIVLAGPLAAWNFLSWADDGVDNMDRAELRALSPLLVEGGTANSKGINVFLGKVDPGRWVTLSRSDRTTAADKLAESLASRRIQHAFISRENTVAVRIQDGVVKQVE